jgi:hypothetical protein
LAIETTLMLGLVFGLRLRQTEGLLASVLELMALDLAVPNHASSTVGRGLGDRPMSGSLAGFQEKGPFTTSSTAPGLTSTALASGWRSSTAPDRGEAGA